jgi:hypothetical protein
MYRLDADAILTLAVFAKKTEKTPDEIIRICRNRLRYYDDTSRKAEFLDLSDQEAAYIELRLKLARGLKARRHARGLSQTRLAKALRSSQSRVAKMEASDPYRLAGSSAAIASGARRLESRSRSDYRPWLTELTALRADVAGIHATYRFG